MTNDDVTKIASAAQMIVNGYAFTLTDNNMVRVVYLHEPHHALVMTTETEIIETNMDDIEIDIVQGYWNTNKKTLEKVYA